MFYLFLALYLQKVRSMNKKNENLHLIIMIYDCEHNGIKFAKNTLHAEVGG